MKINNVYITNQKSPMLKEGATFKADAILAANKQFFEGDSKEVTLTSGYLCKVAMHSGSYTIEDSSKVTSHLTDALSSKITMKKGISLGINSNILSYLKVGSKMMTGDSLL